LARFSYWVDNKWILDPIINAIGRISIFLSAIAGTIDKYVVDGFVNGLGWAADKAGAVLRNTQNGQVQVYLMVVVVSVTIWLLLAALPVLLSLV
jgi:NADH:ubiquinone oxidoreductase subunit 5 (subunit L)/multisubunit Na+/H+ antiporter MnhA subunit